VTPLRIGVWSLTGTIVGQTVPRHTSEAFVTFLSDLVATQSPRREIHVIVDNLSAHKTKGVQAFLDAHPRVHLHFTPTYSSWLNQVPAWSSAWCRLYWSRAAP
jgi:transposase